MKIKAVGAYSAKQPLESMDITRREPGPHDVKIEIAYCGVCHSDIHQVRSEWAGTVYPCVPGHEIVGRVVAVGDQVENMRRAIWLVSAALSTVVNIAKSVKMGWKTTVIT